jgi:hypothetical protein
MATFNALAIVMKSDVPFLVQQARREADDARLGMERGRMMAHDTKDLERLARLVAAKDEQIRVLQTTSNNATDILAEDALYAMLESDWQWPEGLR